MPAPLAARVRPASIDEVVGQRHLLGPDAPFRRALEAGRVPSTLLWGPPGSGKTTIARLVGERQAARLVALSAVHAGLKELRERIAGATPERPVALFLDEIHRWSRTQQDALLPHVEDGSVLLLGATTENPVFHVIPALRSRCWLLRLEPLSEDDLVELLERALAHPDGLPGTKAEAATLRAIARLAAGDARRALSLLERAAQLAGDGDTVDEGTVARLEERAALVHDEDAHHDIVSAFIKSMRGSDPDAALYWLARLLEAGEDPLYVARRVVVFAAEDVGAAEPRALPLAVAAFQAAHAVGMPEARIVLAHAVTWLACAPKSNSAYLGVERAAEEVRRSGQLPVPPHLRNSPGGPRAPYLYPHDFPHHVVAQDYLPAELAGRRFFEPTQQGAEKHLSERLSWYRRRMGRE